MRTSNRRTAGAAAMLAVAALTLVACGDDAATTENTDTTTATSTATSTTETTATETSAAGEGAPAGPGCQAYAEAHPDGPASLDAIADQNIVDAIQNIPELATLTSALTGGLNPDVNLAATLQDGEWTIFAPTEDAFAKVDAATLEALQSDADLLTAVLTALLNASYKKGKPDLNILFQYNMPLRALAKMTNGAISMGMVDGIVMELQGFWIIGMVRVLLEAVKNAVLNSRMEERLKNS